MDEVRIVEEKTDDLRVRGIEELIPPSEILARFPITPQAKSVVADARHDIHRVLHGADDRVVVIVGPCSVHDVKAAKEYGQRLLAMRRKLAGELVVLMRVYFEKPRTTVGWKGLINDPGLDGSFRINDGLQIGRGLLLDLVTAGVPVACEFLDMV